jgi:hypothetical protein
MTISIEVNTQPTPFAGVGFVQHWHCPKPAFCCNTDSNGLVACICWILACASAYICCSPPCILVRSDLPWAGELWIFFGIISELRVAALLSSCGVYICCWLTTAVYMVPAALLACLISSFVCMSNCKHYLKQAFHKRARLTLLTDHAVPRPLLPLLYLHLLAPRHLAVLGQDAS